VRDNISDAVSLRELSLVTQDFTGLHRLNILTQLSDDDQAVAAKPAIVAANQVISCPCFSNSKYSRWWLSTWTAAVSIYVFSGAASFER